MIRRWLSDADEKDEKKTFSMKDLQAKLADAEKERDTYKAKVDAFEAEKAKSDKNKAKDEEEKEKAKDAAEADLRAEVLRRVDLLTKAQKLTQGTDLKVTADMAPRDLRVAVLGKLRPELTITDSVSDAYVEAAFDMLAPASKADETDNSGGGKPPKGVVTDSAGKIQSAYDAYIQNLDHRTAPAE